MGALLLGDLAVRATDLNAMYTDGGMFPRSEICYHYTTIWNWSFHFGSGASWYQGILFALAAGLALALFTGLETRIATIGSWLMLVSLHHRVPPILSGADVLLRMLLFWAMFLPLGRVWSADKWLQENRRGGSAEEVRAPILSVGSAAILLQMGLMYLFSAIFKSNLSWLRGDVVARSLLHDFYASPLGTQLLHLPWLLTCLTWGTFVLEWAALPLLLFPKRTPSLRLWVLAALAIMHVGIAVCMKVDLFSPVDLAGLTLFLPAEFWDRGLLARFLAKPEPAQHLSESGNVNTQGFVFYLKEGICLLLLMNVVVININSLPRPLAFGTPVKTSFLKTACGFGQKWSMFDEVPSKNGWYVAWAKLKDGSDVDLLRNGSALDWTKPYYPAGMYPNFRWRKCFREMAYTDEQGYQVFRAPVVEFLCRDWNRRKAPEKQVAEFDLVYCNEPGGDSKAAPQAPVRERLVHLDFDSEDGRIAVSGI